MPQGYKQIIMRTENYVKLSDFSKGLPSGHIHLENKSVPLLLKVSQVFLSSIKT